MRLSASKLALAEHCRFAFSESNADRVELAIAADPPGEKAQRGSWAHAEIEEHTSALMMTRRGDPLSQRLGQAAIDAPKPPSPRRRWWSEIWQACVPDYLELLGEYGGWETETPLAYDPGSRLARRIDSQTHRDYSNVAPWEIAMTLDLHRVDHRAAVIDHKTGHYHDWAQILVGVAAVDALTECGLPSIMGGFLFWTPNGLVQDLRIFHRDALDKLHDRFAELQRKIEWGDFAARPGDHCNNLYCPLAGTDYCPAFARAIRLAVTQLEEPAAALSANPQTPEQAAANAVHLPMIERWVKKAKQTTREFAAKHDVIRHNDKHTERYAAIQVHRESISVDDAGDDLIAELGLGDVVKRSVSKTDIANQLGKAGSKAAIERLREAGAVRSTTSTRWQWVRT